MNSDESQDPQNAVGGSIPPAGAKRSTSAAPPEPTEGSREKRAEAPGKKLIPPPKPVRESRSNPPPAESEPESHSLTPRAPMIVVGEPGQTRSSGLAQAWSRPPSDRPSAAPRGSSIPPNPSVRADSKPPPTGAPAAVAASVVPAKASPVPPRELAAFAESAETPHPDPPGSAEVVSGLPDNDPPPPLSIHGSLPPRPAGPARLRSGPPRARASSPGAGARSGISPSTPPGSQPGSGGVLVPSAPRIPQFSGVSHISAPAAPEEFRARRSEPPMPASAIAVMKIIAIGDPRSEPTVELGEAEGGEEVQEAESAAEAIEGDQLADPLAVAESSIAAEAAFDDAKAPDSGERKTPIPELSSEDAVPMLEEEAEPEGGVAREAEVRPPPPPKRSPKTPTLPKTLPQVKRRHKRPWWEDVFGEDFLRAASRPTDAQIRREVDFIEESLGIATGGIVLDLCCGSGHHAVELASRGYGVVGYDLSLYQLSLAAEVAQERRQKLNFLQGDMREMAFEEMFDGIFCWNTSFGYFEEDKNLLVAERAFHALRPGGMLLLDVVNRDFVASQSPGQHWYEGDSCVCMDDMSLDFITSRMRVKRSVILDDGRTRECLFSLRVYSMHELGKLLHEVGFRISEASGHPATPGVFFGQSSPRIIMLAQKP